MFDVIQSLGFWNTYIQIRQLLLNANVLSAFFYLLIMYVFMLYWEVIFVMLALMWIFMNSFVFFPYAALKVCNPNGKRNPTTMIKCKDHQTTLNTINYVQYQFWFRHPHNLLIVCIIHTTYSYIHNKVHLTQLLLFYDFWSVSFASIWISWMCQNIWKRQIIIALVVVTTTRGLKMS